MKKVALATALLMVLGLTVSVRPTSAAGSGNFWGGFAAGTATGLVVGTVVAPRYYAPPPVYYAPAPVYVYPAQPMCRDYYTEGYWRQVPMMDAGGFTTYRNDWIPGSSQRVCP